MTLRVFSVTPVISAGGIYAAADAVGGLLTFENVCSAFEPSAEIIAAIMVDRDKESDLLDLLLFDQTVTATADNSPLAVSDADLAHLIGIISFPAASYSDLDANSVCYVELATPIRLIDGGTDLFGLLRSGATPTYTAVGDLTVRLIVRS